MSTKFVSKNSNYAIVLKPGVEGSRVLGTQSIPGIYVKFVGGSVDVKEESILKMLREHPSYGLDFLEVKEGELDPLADTREEVEPGHVISDIKYGHVEKSSGTPPKVKITPQLKKILEGEALKMIPGLLKQNPEILKNIILDLAAGMKKEEEKTDKKEVKSTEKKS